MGDMTKERFDRVRKETYEAVDSFYVQVVANVIAEGKYGYSIRQIADIASDAIMLGAFVTDLYMEAGKDRQGEMIEWLSTEDGGLIDSGNFNRLLIALDYALHNGLIELPHDRLPQTVKDFMENQKK